MLMFNAYPLTLFHVANLHIDRLNNAYFADDAALMAIRPLMIGENDVSDRFWRYEPPTE